MPKGIGYEKAIRKSGKQGKKRAAKMKMERRKK